MTTADAPGTETGGADGHIVWDQQRSELNTHTSPKQTWTKEQSNCVEDLCQSMGFYYGGSASGVGLHKDCVNPIRRGEHVPSVSETAVVACLSE
jgi:hypothetical protein